MAKENNGKGDAIYVFVRNTAMGLNGTRKKPVYKGGTTAGTDLRLLWNLDIYRTGPCEETKVVRRLEIQQNRRLLGRLM